MAKTGAILADATATINVQKWQNQHNTARNAAYSGVSQIQTVQNHPAQPGVNKVPYPSHAPENEC
jgi:hypothetical protein